MGLLEENKFWEDIKSIQRLIDDNLEDKVESVEGGDVTVQLDLETVVSRLKDDLNIKEEITGELVDRDAPTGEDPIRRATRSKRKNQDNNYIYY